jgi:hypothetical protein
MKTRDLTFNGKTQPIAHWAREIGMKMPALWDRINRGWSVERALTEPVRAQRKRDEGCRCDPRRWADHAPGCKVDD